MRLFEAKSLMLAWQYLATPRVRCLVQHLGACQPVGENRRPRKSRPLTPTTTTNSACPKGDNAGTDVGGGATPGEMNCPKATGKLPTATVAVTLFVAVSITETVPG